MAPTETIPETPTKGIEEFFAGLNPNEFYLVYRDAMALRVLLAVLSQVKHDRCRHAPVE